MNVIERYCCDVMKLMGYIVIEGLVEMFKNFIILFFVENYLVVKYWIEE